MKVKCINTGDYWLTKGKVYLVHDESKTAYYIFNDLDRDKWCEKELFEIIEGEKERRLTFEEVFNTIKGKEVWESENLIVYLRDSNQLSIDWKNGTEDIGVDINLNEIFKLRREKVSFIKAYEAYEQGKVIESCLEGCQYKKKDGVDWYKKADDIDWNSWSVEKGGFTFEEIRNLWYINE